MSDISAYVAELDRALVGTRRGKRSLLTETADHLTDAAEAYAGTGRDRSEAEHLAVRDFGSVADIAADYQTELGIALGRRTSLLMLAALGIQPVIWQPGMPWSDDGEQPLGPVSAAADAAIETFGGIALILAAVMVLGCGVGSRYVASRRRFARSVAVAALTVCTLLPLLATVLVASGSHGDTVTSLLVGFGWVTLLLLAPLSLVASSARRCLTATARRAPMA